MKTVKSLMMFFIMSCCVGGLHGKLANKIEKYPEVASGKDKVAIYNEGDEPLYIALVKTANLSSDKRLYVEEGSKSTVRVLVANQTEYPAALAGHRFAVLQNSGGGLAYNRSLWVSYKKDDLKYALDNGSTENFPQVYVVRVGSDKKVIITPNATKTKGDKPFLGFKSSGKIVQSAESFHKAARVGWVIK